jgi:uncharacterized protein YegP (UPF0339 family)
MSETIKTNRTEVCHGKYVIREVPSGIKFDLKATNGQVIATPRFMQALPPAINGIESVRKERRLPHRRIIR